MVCASSSVFGEAGFKVDPKPASQLTAKHLVHTLRYLRQLNVI